MPDHRLSSGMRALLLVVGAAVFGAAYVLYLKTEPFPSDIVRIIPFAWLAGSIVGATLATRALRSGGNRPAAGLAFALSMPNTALAALYAMAALMGD